MSAWRTLTLGEVILLQRGFDLTEKSAVPGPYPVISSGGINYTTSEPKVNGPGVVTGRKGMLGKVYYSSGSFWPHDTTLWVKDFKGSDPRFVYYLLQCLPLASLDAGASNPTLNRNHAHLLPVRVPDTDTQARISAVLGGIDDLIENNRRRAEVLEEIARAIYREWFVHFRFPGHEDTTYLVSELGPVPAGWEVTDVQSVGAQERWAITAGPFGSKLGRRDYVDIGVPVLRGSNLSVGGGFDDSDLVYVTPEKAKELRSCWAVRGDVVLTQRGTLGQIGLIPDLSQHETYVLSQSQMKVTLNNNRMSTFVFYEQMRSPEVTRRFIARAMTSGVPHVNLGLLREFQILLPAIDIQRMFDATVEPLHCERVHLTEQIKRLRAIRDLLLPKLVTGQIEVSNLDLDGVVEQASV